MTCIAFSTLCVYINNKSLQYILHFLELLLYIIFAFHMLYITEIDDNLLVPATTRTLAGRILVGGSLIDDINHNRRRRQLLLFWQHTLLGIIVGYSSNIPSYHIHVHDDDTYGHDVVGNSTAPRIITTTMVHIIPNDDTTMLIGILSNLTTNTNADAELFPS
jgi:hypothetical protein